MKPSEIKKLLIISLNVDADTVDVCNRLQEEILPFDFSKGFSEKILNKIAASGAIIKQEVDYVRSMNFVFSRIALTGAAAIIVLLISIFLMEGSLSLNSFLGLSDSYDESIVSLLTGN